MWREEPQEPQSSGGSHREGREGQGDLSQQVRLCRERDRQEGNRLLKEETYREGKEAGATILCRRQTSYRIRRRKCHISRRRTKT